jgi:putative endonuclease
VRGGKSEHRRAGYFEKPEVLRAISLENGKCHRKHTAPHLSGFGNTLRRAVMHYVYILRNQNDSSIYIGFTDDLRRRIKEHNSKDNGVWGLVYYEAYKAKKDALLREKRLKYYGKALGQLKRRIENSLLS